MDKQEDWKFSEVPADSAAHCHFSDSDDEGEVNHAGDYSHYSQQIDDLFEEGEHEESTLNDGHDLSSDEDGFVYSGVDAPDMSVSYHDQLRDVLDQEDREGSLGRTDDHETSLLADGEHEPLDQFEYQEEALSNNSPAMSATPMTPPSRTLSPALLGRSPRLNRPYLHPTVSRLRSSALRQDSPAPSDRESYPLSQSSRLFDVSSPSPSQFSSISRTSSASNLRASSNGRRTTGLASPSDRQVFKWSELHSITHQIFSKASQKASSVLGKATFGTPTVLAANGFICLGLEDGRIMVFDFKQTLKAVCGDASLASTMGPVTALALSHDHTCIASGHASGHIRLYELKKPGVPLRAVAPTTLAVVATGRKEGHLQGSRIVNIGFVAGRHTALVSADEHGLAFYHSLGKVLFVEAPDILRILGHYPEPLHVPSPGSSALPALNGNRNPRYAILAMAPLPLGTVPHTTDAYDVVAMLTPTKLVVVGIRPAPKTWFKCPREPEEGRLSRTKMKGTLAWFPSITRHSGKGHVNRQVTVVNPKEGVLSADDPILAYTWGNSLRFIRVMESKFRQRVRSAKTGKASEVEIGSIVYESLGRYAAEDTIIALQWLHADQVVFVMKSSMAVYDLRMSRIIEQASFDGLSLVSPTMARTANGSVSYVDAAMDTAHSLRVYKGKMFVLHRDSVRVGSMLTWADRILSMVEAGDFLGAIELCRTYYTNEAPGNRNGLPDDRKLCQTVVGEKLRNLLDASAQYAFSEDRLTDDTHRTPGGVDRTSLFEGLVSTCCRACISLDDFDFLFEDLFHLYDEAGIAIIYLRQLEPFILDNEIRYVPPRITQRLIALHDANNQSEYVERIIWHMDPACLDLNQTITLCQKFHLYDALIYIYTRALQDYVAPVVELLGLIRRLQRLQWVQSIGMQDTALENEADMDTLVSNAYKIYPYLSSVLSGLSYPSEERLPEDEADSAKKALYSFLFFGRSSVWPPGNDGKLVLTAIEEGGMEPTYPYVRQLLRFDAEAFLNSLDIAFEDSFLNDETRSVNRLMMVRILLDILADDELSSEDITFVNIFIARNVPKYPQDLQVAPTILRRVLTALAHDQDPSTGEDRQLAAEFLLSVYRPHDSEEVIRLFEDAHFYRILRSWYKKDRRWAELLSTYINDQRIYPSDLFVEVHTTLSTASSHNCRKIPDDVEQVLSQSIPRLLHASISDTAILIEIHSPKRHEEALGVIQSEFVGEEEAVFTYLKQLFVGAAETQSPLPKLKVDLSRLPHSMLQTFLDLQTRLHPDTAVDVLKQLDASIVDWPEVAEVCERNEAWDTVIWVLDWRQEPQEAIRKSEAFHNRLVRRVVKSISAGSSASRDLDLFKSLGTIGRDICLQRSQAHDQTEVPLEDLWFGLLSSQIHAVQEVSSSGLETQSDQLQKVLGHLRSLVQTTFTALVSVTSTQAVSFPRLFKRLVASVPPAIGSQYTEFRLILSGMMESYRSDADMLNITNHLLERDLYDIVSRFVAAKKRGWAPASGSCTVCRQPLLPQLVKSTPTQPLQASVGEIVVSRTGSISHSFCSQQLRHAP